MSRLATFAVASLVYPIVGLGLAGAAPSQVDGPLLLRKGRITVDRSGHVRNGERLLAQLPMPPGTKRLVVRRPRVGRKTLTWITVLGNEEHASDLVVDSGGTPIFAGPTGPQGVDGEWSQHIALLSGKLVVFQRRLGIDRCDQRAAFLFPRAWDAGKRRFRPLRLRADSTRLPLLTARTKAPHAMTAAITDMPLNTFQWTAASAQLGRASAANLTAPIEAGDQRIETAWTATGAAIGTFLTARSRQSPYAVRALRLIPGAGASSKDWLENHRLRQITVSFSAGERYRVRFARDPKAATTGATAGRFRPPVYWIILPKPIRTRCVTVEIEALYPPLARRRHARTAIAELQVLTDLDLQPARLEHDLVSADTRRSGHAVAVLARRGRAALPLLERLLPAAGLPLLRTILDLAANIRSAAAFGLIVKLARRLPARDRPRLEHALLRAGTLAVPHLIALLAKRDWLARSSAFVLGRVGGPKASTALLAELGSGSEHYRAGVASALAALRDPALPRALLQIAGDARQSTKRRADAVCVLGRSRALKRPTRHAIATRLVRLFDAPNFELRFRVLHAVAKLSPARELALFTTALRSKDPILRWIAVQELSASHNAPPATFLTALGDPDPRVRAAAATGLSRNRSTAISAALARQLERDRWPLPAQAAARALGKQCDATSLRALKRAIRVRGLGIDHQALVALVECKPPKLVEVLLGLALSPKQPTALRQHAVALLPEDRRLAASVDTLVQAFLVLRKRASRRYTAERVAIGLARKLGALRASKVARVLADTLALEPSPTIRTAAAMALARSCHPLAKPTLQRALSDRAPLVRAAAKRALSHCP